MTCGAPLLTRKTAPDCSLIVASVRLCTGSNGTYASCWYFLRTDWSLSPANIARSIGSSSAAREASDAIKISVSGSVPGRGCAWPRVSLFSVNVPVLSEQSTSTPASSSIASNRDTIALRFASSRAPNAMVTDKTAGIATGTEATRRIRTISASLNRTARS